MFIALAKMGQSPFNRSIWTGFSAAFQELGCRVLEIDAEKIPHPSGFPVQPDLLFAVHGGTVPSAAVDAYRKHNIPTAVHLLDEPYEIDATQAWARHYDWVFSVDRATVPVHAQNTNAAHLPLAYNDRVFNPDVQGIPSEILILGSPYSVREEILGPVRDRWAPRITWVGPGWRKISPRGQHVEGLVTPADCARFYQGAKIVINIHRDSVWSHFGDLNKRHIKATHLNPRFWEASGCGAFQLCSYRPDLDQFSPHTASFKTTEDLINKLDYFLNNDKARKDNANRVYKKIRGHTYLARARSIIEIMGLGDTGTT